MEAKSRKQKVVKQVIVIFVSLIVCGVLLGHAEVKIDEMTSSEAPSTDVNNEVQIQTCEVVSVTIRYVTAYNVDDVNQCDNDPCISANGEDICEALDNGYSRCAANFVPFGTTLNIQNFGECVVTDRMNRRYRNRVDIAMKKHEKEKALVFGIQKLNVQILAKL
ncbi:MAG: 3D domain-containing protein [Desulfobulbaceae bacterium]|nr:3D domain-containing protein [Desulfobulbaceae bacterium]